MAFSGQSFCPVAGFRFHFFGEDILLFKQHIQGAHDFGQRPLAGMQGRQNGGQNIGVMADFIQIVDVIVIAVGGFIVVQLALQSRFHGAVGSFRSLNRIVRGSIGTAGDTGNDTLHDHCAGGKSAEEKAQQHEKTKDDQKSLAVLLYEGGSLFAGFRSFLCSLLRNAGSSLRCASGSTCFGGGILALDGLPLLEFGKGVAGGVIQFHLLLQGI